MNEEAQALSSVASQQLRDFVGSIMDKVEGKRSARDKSVREAADMRRQISAKESKLTVIEDRLASQERSLADLDGIAERVESLRSELAELQARVDDTSDERIIRMSEIWMLLEVERDDVMRIFYGKAK